MNEVKKKTHVIVIVKNDKYLSRILELIALYGVIYVAGVEESGISEDTKIALSSNGYCFLKMKAKPNEGDAYLYLDPKREFDPTKLVNENLLVRLCETIEEATVFETECANVGIVTEILN